jgi:hypothetical protein
VLQDKRFKVCHPRNKQETSVWFGFWGMTVPADSVSVEP